MQLILYLPAGRQVLLLGFIRPATAAVDKQYVDEDIFFSQRSRKPHVSGSVCVPVYVLLKARIERFILHLFE
jgi:hypothetical protein